MKILRQTRVTCISTFLHNVLASFFACAVPWWPSIHCQWQGLPSDSDVWNREDPAKTSHTWEAKDTLFCLRPQTQACTHISQCPWPISFCKYSCPRTQNAVSLWSHLPFDRSLRDICLEFTLSLSLMTSQNSFQPCFPELCRIKHKPKILAQPG